MRGAGGTVVPGRDGNARRLPGATGSLNAAALQAGAGRLWVCEGAFDALPPDLTRGAVADVLTAVMGDWD